MALLDNVELLGARNCSYHSNQSKEVFNVALVSTSNIPRSILWTRGRTVQRRGQPAAVSGGVRHVCDHTPLSNLLASAMSEP